MESSSSSDQVKNVDWISKLPDDVLLVILSRLSTEEAIRTSIVSKRWEHAWKQMSHLVLDMQRLIDDKEPLDSSIRAATLLTKVLNNHNGHLESCVIDHFSYHGTNGMLNAWIRLSTCVKHTKSLTLTHHFDSLERTKAFNVLSDCFSHPSLTSLSLQGYILDTSHCFNNCQNLKTLKLHFIMGLEVGVFNRVLAFCPSLQVLVLHVTCFKRCTGGPLKIENKKLKIFQVLSCKDIVGFRVSAPCLDILAIRNTSFSRDGLVLTSPRLHEFNRISWRNKPHISYNISKERKSIVHEEFVNICGELLMETPSLSVSVDLMNPTEVERLRQVLRLWTCKMNELEILFKNNNAHREEEEEEYSSQKKLWEDNNNEDPFPNAEFRVDTVWMHNFSGSEEEFALASRLIRQGTVVKQMMIKTTSFPARKKLEIETAVAKLQTLQRKDQWELTIECF
ncbi:unnamed protein product [Microthlaspi erraticum]|uniref:F-box domain-containing protein n=1 Tax=Microthlaspi erraticum TaxID=1685480 RepID=A0A6D2JCR5_9BRAS|nr:unnamed protein product [Microthlaspi erraticum]